jgi:hypothetical protein
MAPPKGLTRATADDRTGEPSDLSVLAGQVFTPVAPQPPLIEQASTLFLSQTCGMPLTSVHRDALRIVAVPRYTAPGCGPDATYRSCVVVRKMAINRQGSDSGSRLGIEGAVSAHGEARPPLVAAVNSDGSCSGSLLLGAFLATTGATIGRQLSTAMAAAPFPGTTLSEVAWNDELRDTLGRLRVSVWQSEGSLDTALFPDGLFVDELDLSGRHWLVRDDATGSVVAAARLTWHESLDDGYGSQRQIIFMHTQGEALAGD